MRRKNYFHITKAEIAYFLGLLYYSVGLLFIFYLSQLNFEKDEILHDPAVHKNTRLTLDP